MTETREIRALLAPIHDNGILVPGSAVAEVIDYAQPDPFADAPDWLLGELEWNAWQIPVVHFAHLIGATPETTVPPRSRILVVKSLAESSNVGYIGLIITGMPRLRTVTTGNLAESEEETSLGVFSHVTVEDQPAIIPDLDALAEAIESAVYND